MSLNPKEACNLTGVKESQDNFKTKAAAEILVTRQKTRLTVSVLRAEPRRTLGGPQSVIINSKTLNPTSWVQIPLTKMTVEDSLNGKKFLPLF